jgi:hypothetical protein
MTASLVHPSSDRASNLPRFPVELFLDIFSYADRPTLARLSLVDFTFLELITPLIYRTAHIDDLPLPDASRTSRLAELLRFLVLSSVQTLHITPSNDGPFLPRLDLPKLVHLHIHHCRLLHINCRYTTFSSCANLLSNLDPLLLTFQQRQPSSSREWHDWSCTSKDGWTRWLLSRIRLRELVFRGGSLDGVIRREGDEPLVNELVRLTVDIRRATEEDVITWSDMGWPRDLGMPGMWDVPLRQICFRTSSLDIKQWVEGDSDDMEENLEDEPSGTGVDKAGRTFRERIEVTLEEDWPEWDDEEAELDFWRARGKGRWPRIETGDPGL